jgi:glycosyltransferase involved in cell wall biosynthesis
MRVGLVSSGFAPRLGGVERHVARLGAELVRRSHDVEVLTQEPDAQLPSVEDVNGMIVRRFPVPVPINAYEVAPQLWSWLGAHGDDYDLIHAHNYHATPALAALRGERTLVFTPHYHGTGHSRFRRMLHPMYRCVGRRVFNRAGAVICVSRPEASLVARDFPSVANRINVVPNGVDPPSLDVRPYAVDRPVVLFVGRIERYKNVQLLADAMETVDDAVLVVIGDGPARATFSPSHRVQVLGRVSDDELLRWYRTATVVASLSDHEAFGLAVVEGLNGGARVLASSIPAHVDLAVAHPNRVDLVAPGASASDVAQALRRTLAKGRAGRPALASWSAVADATLSIYEAALAR